MAHTAWADASRRELTRTSVPLVAACALVLAAALAGGSSWNARLPLIGLELAAVPVLLLGARGLVRGGAVREVWPCLALAVFLLAVPLLQSIPLTATLWLGMPSQQPRFTALVLSGLSLPTEPISLDPRATLACAFALLPPIAMLLVTLCLSRAERRVLAATWIAAALAGLLLGLIQLAEPQGGAAYLYAPTNQGSLVGWFANRNHEAAFLLALIPLAAAVASRAGTTRWLAWPFLLVVLVAVAANRSRAGILMAIPVSLVSLLVLARPATGRRRWEIAVLASRSWSPPSPPPLSPSVRSRDGS